MGRSVEVSSAQEPAETKPGGGGHEPASVRVCLFRGPGEAMEVGGGGPSHGAPEKPAHPGGRGRPPPPPSRPARPATRGGRWVGLVRRTARVPSDGLRRCRGHTSGGKRGGRLFGRPGSGFRSRGWGHDVDGRKGGEASGGAFCPFFFFFFFFCLLLCSSLNGLGSLSWTNTSEPGGGGWLNNDPTRPGRNVVKRKAEQSRAGERRGTGNGIWSGRGRARIPPLPPAAPGL
ncbi:hypothetical protein LY76DRAFT_381050 [Colletotrichum caudatum]|nr:hypothetical protein LY76DRAFT_381050 [Colletotrichum caudatum]